MKEPVQIPDYIKQLISCHLSDSLTSDELFVLKSWVDESSVHKKYFNEMRDAWIMSGKDIQTDREKEKNLLELVGKLSKRRHDNHRSFWTWHRIAASWLLILVGAGALGWYMHGDSTVESVPMTTAMTTIQAKMGSQSTVDMPDGTKVWLNGGSRLTYSNTYGEHDRTVQLTGEGCFDVVTNPEKPFVVKAGALAIKAYGTLFNVKAYPEDKAITTTLVKGQVTIEGKDAYNKTFSHVMQPNENVTYPTEYIEKEETRQPAENHEVIIVPDDTVEPVMVEKNIKTELYTSWKDDLWVIEKQKLGELSKDFARRYGVNIVFSSRNVSDYHFSGTIQRETIEQVMKILSRTIPLKYSFDKNIITIKEDQVLLKEFHSKNK